MSMADDWNKLCEENEDFDEKKWEALINSDALFNEQFSKSINTVDCSSADIVKLSVRDLKRSTFLHTDKFIHTGRSMTILIPPSLDQRVRYENECEKILRFISIPQNNTMTIGIPDIRDILAIGDALWMRITRTTINHRQDNLIFYHPYPIWITNKNAKIHNGSIFVQITDKDMENGFMKIDTLTMIRLKQDDLAKIDTLRIYLLTQLDAFDLHHIEIRAPKRIRDEYKLRQSVLNFQLVRIDQNNIAYPTDCFCQTESIREIEANGQQQQGAKFHSSNTVKSNDIDIMFNQGTLGKCSSI